MKKILWVGLLSLLFGVVFGFTGRVKEKVNVEEGINDDVYMVGKQFNIDQYINGDLHLIGSDIQIASGVQQDLVLIGQKVEIDGQIDDDIRVIARKLIIDGDVGDDVLFLGQELQIKSGSTIGWDLGMVGSRLEMHWNIQGDLQYKWDELNFGWVVEQDGQIQAWKIFVRTGSINGRLEYTSKNKSESLEWVVTSNNIDFQKIKDSETNKAFQNMASQIMGSSWQDKLKKSFELFVLGVLFVFGFSKLFDKTVKKLQDMPGQCLLTGLAVYWLGRIVGIFLILSIVGKVFWMLALIMWFALWFLTSIINVSVYSAVLIDYIEKEYKKVNRWHKSIVILAISFGFAWLPGFIGILFGVFALGALIKTKMEFVKDHLM